MRCDAESSIFWWPYTFGDEKYYLCDDCQLSFVKWLREGKK